MLARLPGQPGEHGTLKQDHHPAQDREEEAHARDRPAQSAHRMNRKGSVKDVEAEEDQEVQDEIKGDLGYLQHFGEARLSPRVQVVALFVLLAERLTHSLVVLPGLHSKGLRFRQQGQDDEDRRERNPHGG
jgi:hypothetical protein